MSDCCDCLLLQVITLTIGVTLARMGAMYTKKSHEFADYSYLTEDKFDFSGLGAALLQCISGMGPFSHSEGSLSLGGWYFHGNKINAGKICDSVFQVRSESPKYYPGIISLYPCGPLSPDEEGVYTCMMENSSMMVETRKMGLYLTGRSE